MRIKHHIGRHRAIFPGPSEQIQGSGVHHPQQQPVVDTGPPHFTSICDLVMQDADEEAAFHQAVSGSPSPSLILK